MNSVGKGHLVRRHKHHRGPKASIKDVVGGRVEGKVGEQVPVQKAVARIHVLICRCRCVIVGTCVCGIYLCMQKKSKQTRRTHIHTSHARFYLIMLDPFLSVHAGQEEGTLRFHRGITNG